MYVNSNFKYYILFTDFFSRFSWIYFFCHKSEVVLIFVLFKVKVENQLSKQIKIRNCEVKENLLVVIREQDNETD